MSNPLLCPLLQLPTKNMSRVSHRQMRLIMEGKRETFPMIQTNGRLLDSCPSKHIVTPKDPVNPEVLS